MLSNSCRYGIRAMIFLAKESKNGGNTGIKKISEDLGLPSPFLAKILMQLAKQKILISTKGPHGGFSLLVSPEKITVLDVIIAIDGQDIFTNCVIHNGSCETLGREKKYCPLHEEYEKTRRDLVTLFKSKTIYDLAERADNSDLITI
jgi:Rrf2 family transcriptional regulator, iron-sulfur cluster assembly transcription factor